jgi:integrase
MPRKATGTAQWAGDHWKVRITLPKPPGATSAPRPWIDLPPEIKTEAQACAKASELSRLARARQGALIDTSQPSPSSTETMRVWCERWFKHRRQQGQTSARVVESYVQTHVLPRLGDLAMARITKTQLEDLVTELDDKAIAGKITGKTARNIWGVVSKMFADAQNAKRRELRVREDNPALGIAPPEPGNEKAKVYLYPNEFLAVAECHRVPVRWAQLYAMQIYLYPRPGELEVLDCGSVDLEHGVVHFHIARNDLTGGIKELKTGVARYVPIEPTVRPLVEQLFHEVKGRGLLIPWFPHERRLAPNLRQHLQLAGINRAGLFASDATRKPLRFYDLRATGITWCAVRGDDAIKIQRRAGHEEFKTTEGYIREAENLSAGFGVPFPPLPARLLESSGNRPAPTPSFVQHVETTQNSVAEAVGFEPQTTRAESSQTVSFRKDSDPPKSPQSTVRDVPDDSGTIPTSPRQALVTALTNAVRDATVAGDLAAARIALESLNRLLAEPSGTPAAVADLAERRKGSGRST